MNFTSLLPHNTRTIILTHQIFPDIPPPHHCPPPKKNTRNRQFEVLSINIIPKQHLSLAVSSVAVEIWAEYILGNGTRKMCCFSSCSMCVYVCLCMCLKTTTMVPTMVHLLVQFFLRGHSDKWHFWEERLSGIIYFSWFYWMFPFFLLLHHWWSSFLEVSMRSLLVVVRDKIERRTTQRAMLWDI